MQRVRLHVTGATGYLGSELVRLRPDATKRAGRDSRRGRGRGAAAPASTRGRDPHGLPAGRADGARDQRRRRRERRPGCGACRRAARPPVLGRRLRRPEGSGVRGGGRALARQRLRAREGRGRAPRRHRASRGAGRPNLVDRGRRTAVEARARRSRAANVVHERDPLPRAGDRSRRARCSSWPSSTSPGRCTSPAPTRSRGQSSPSSSPGALWQPPRHRRRDRSTAGSTPRRPRLCSGRVCAASAKSSPRRRTARAGSLRSRPQRAGAASAPGSSGPMRRA